MTCLLSVTMTLYWLYYGDITRIWSDEELALAEASGIEASSLPTPSSNVSSMIFLK